LNSRPGTINYRRISYVLAWILVFLAGGMLLPFFVSLLYSDGDSMALLYSVICSAFVGAAVAYMTRKQSSGELTVREGFVVVTLGWVLISIFGALPFAFSGCITNPVDALFESMSGFTTTGASILVSPQDLPHGIAFWRCFMQWIGGLGIVLFGLAILPMLGVGGMHLFKAETPGPSSEKITPRLKDTAKILWLIYVGLTTIEALLLWLGPLNFFDAWAHSFTTMATGGFSTYNASVGYWDSAYVHLVISLFMFMAGINFALYFRALQGKSLKEIFNDSEWQTYSRITLAAVLIFTVLLVLNNGRDWIEALVSSIFQTTSIMTTTGFATDDFNGWHSLARVVLIALMLIGGMAGSTGGGMKVVRVKIMFSHARLCLRKMIQPRALTLVMLGGKSVSQDLVMNITGFLVLFLMGIATGTLVLTACGHDFELSVTATIACLSNIGPGLGEVGPAGNFAGIHTIGKVVLTALMLLGRLEIYTVLAIFSRHFWKK
jgi:trk system potassium uptake protein